MFKKLSFVDLFKRGEYINLSKEEQKLYKLTQCNTLLNRDMLDKREVYLKNVQSEYKDIYGSKGEKVCRAVQKNQNLHLKKIIKLGFLIISNIVEIKFGYNIIYDIIWLYKFF